MTRADALRNRERVVAAAREVFAERGLEAGVDEVATRAGVGKATVYRSFPTKEHLFAAVAIQRLAWFQERVEAAAERPDAFAAFEDLLVSIAEVQAGDRVIGGSLAGAAGDVPEFAEAKARLSAAMERLLAGGRAAGEIAPDVTGDDLSVLFGGMCRMLGERGERDPAVWRRQARLVAAAFRVSPR